jgi:hypothetical protein
MTLIKLLMDNKTTISSLLVMASSKNIYTFKIEIQELDISVFTLLPLPRNGSISTRGVHDKMKNPHG